MRYKPGSQSIYKPSVWRCVLGGTTAVAFGLICSSALLILFGGNTDKLGSFIFVGLFGVLFLVYGVHHLHVFIRNSRIVLEDEGLTIDISAKTKELGLIKWSEIEDIHILPIPGVPYGRQGIILSIFF